MKAFQQTRGNSAAHSRFVRCFLVLGAIGFLLALQALFRPNTLDGIYFQMWSSENMMQTVSVELLQSEPFRTLFYLHIQPPALDALRALLAAIFPLAQGIELVQRVDQALYFVWALVYAGLVGLVYTWLEKVTRPWYALLVSIIFMLHPALIFYATFLETTLLTSTVVLWLFYNLWKIKVQPEQSIWPFTISVLAMFFIRSIFQWQVVFLFLISLLLLQIPYKKILVFVCVAGSIMGVYTLKQWIVFGLPSTTSFTGMSLLKSIDRLDVKWYHSYLNQQQMTTPDYLDHGILENFNNPPQVLINPSKLNGTANYNHYRYLELDSELRALYWKSLEEISVAELLQRYALNFRIYLQPSSGYTQHVIVDRLFWRGIYDRIFSYPIILWISLGMLFVSLPAIRRQPAATLAYLLPAGFIALICIVAESGENMRFKFFLEPVWFCFLAMQGYTSGKFFLRKILGN